MVLALTTEQRDKMAAIFMPYAWDRQLAAQQQSQFRLAHYTNAAAAASIITKKTFWLRNARAMQDFSEVQYGHARLIAKFRENDYARRNALREACDRCVEDACAAAMTRYDQWWETIDRETYIGCFSEHFESENEHGRLSMWRAFSAPATGVALVIHPPFASANGLQVFMSPVAYFSDAQLEDELERIIKNVHDSRDFLRAFPSEVLQGNIFAALLMLTVSQKHPGFDEERGWRLVYSPRLAKSPRVSVETEVINGVPQLVQKLELHNDPEHGIDGIEIPQLFDRLIIGPSDYAITIYDALVAALNAAGVADAGARVWVSGIPIR